jgi:hypothetical protein
MRNTAFAGLVFLATACSGPQATAPLPPEVEAAIAEARGMCTSMEGELLPATAEAPWTRLGDFNADGQQDFVLDYAGFQCTTAASLFCGSAGCSVEVFMSQPDGGHTRTGAGNFEEFAIVRVGDHDVIEFAEHGSEVGADAAKAQLEWREGAWARSGR